MHELTLSQLLGKLNRLVEKNPALLDADVVVEIGGTPNYIQLGGVSVSPNWDIFNANDDSVVVLRQFP